MAGTAATTPLWRAALPSQCAVTPSLSFPSAKLQPNLRGFTPKLSCLRLKNKDVGEVSRNFKGR